MTSGYSYYLACLLAMLSVEDAVELRSVEPVVARDFRQMIIPYPPAGIIDVEERGIRRIGPAATPYGRYGLVMTQVPSFSPSSSVKLPKTRFDSDRLRL